MANPFSFPLYQEVLNAFDAAAAKPQGTEPDYLVLARQQAMTRFRELGFPTIRVEDWKYTNLTAFLQESFQLGPSEEAAPGLSGDLLAAALIPGLDCYQLVVYNGYYQGAASSLPPAVKVCRLSEAWNRPILQQHFGRHLDVSRHHFVALNTALFSDGLFIQIDAKTQLDKPLHLVHVYAGEENLLVQPRHLVVVQSQASLSLVETLVSTNGARVLVNGVTEVLVGENARLDHYMLQAAASKALRHLQHTEVDQQRDSLYSNYTFCLPGAELLRNNLHVNLEAEHTQSHLYGFYLGAQHQLIDNHTLMNHRKPNCESNEIYKGVLLDTATGVFNGKIFVQPDAQKTNAFQQNNNLLLSPKAVSYSKPQLEIYADDVKCSHGSTTGQLNPEALFYLRSRGIGEASARALLVEAFAYDVTAQVKLPELQVLIHDLIKEHLPLYQEMVKA